ncbi:MAG: hypothetical protein WBR31_07265, partial [Candidatus Sulfotelmatobacter sp.]
LQSRAKRLPTLCHSDPFAAAPSGEKGGGIRCRLHHHNPSGTKRHLAAPWKSGASAPRKAREGHDFSRAIKRPRKNPASAAEGGSNISRTAEAGEVNKR